MDTSSLEELCRAVSLQLARVKGITAIVLGGSQARGRARPDSDVDIGLYYESETPFSIPELDAVVCELDDRCQSGLVTGFGDWGAGVNGGGWLKIGGRKVDLLYRDLNKVSLAIESCRLGRPEAFYQLGHPQGFQSQIWMAEVHSCRVLSDPFGVITRLKELTTDYPPLLRQALIEKHLFDAGFELMIARGPAARGDLLFVTGCLFRAAGFITLVLYALNQRYFINEKGAFDESSKFELKPPQLHDELAVVLAKIGYDPAAMSNSITRVEATLAGLRQFCAM